MRRPDSQISIATTKSLKTSIDEVDFSEPSPLKARSSTHEPSSIEEIITAKSEATSMENIDNLSAVDSETFDTSLEHIQNENNEKILATDGTAAGNPEIIVDGIDDDADVGAAKIEDTLEIVERQPNEPLLAAPFLDSKADNDTDDNYALSDSESRNTSSPDDSSDFPTIVAAPFVKPNTAPATEKPHIEKPSTIHRFLKRNRISPAKTCPSSAAAPRTVDIYPASARQPDKPRDLAANCLHQLDAANDWTVVVNGLNGFQQLIHKHPDLVEANVHAYCLALSKHVRNLRSQVSRLACQVSAEFYQTHAKHLELESEGGCTMISSRLIDCG